MKKNRREAAVFFFAIGFLIQTKLQQKKWQGITAADLPLLEPYKIALHIERHLLRLNVPVMPTHVLNQWHH